MYMDVCMYELIGGGTQILPVFQGAPKFWQILIIKKLKKLFGVEYLDFASENQKASTNQYFFLKGPSWVW